MRKFLCREFLAKGYEVSIAQNGSEVLTSLKQPSPPALLLMDMHLLGCERSEFWNQVLADPSSPFIVIHAFSDDTLPLELSGRAARVDKTGDMELLVRAVSWCLSRSNRARDKA